MTERQGTFPKGKKDERGMAFIIALLAVVLLMLMGTVFLSVSLTETTISSNHIDTAEAFEISEAGLEHARRELFVVGINSVLATCSGGKGKGKGKGPATCTVPINFTIGGQNVSFAGGTYSVAVRDDADDADPTVDSNGQVVVTATGTHENTTQVIEATLVDRFLKGAFITGGDLIISGDTTVGGPYGTIHANGDLDVTGNPTISQGLTASGSYSSSGSPVVGGDEGGGKPLMEIPPVDPAIHRPLADYVLKADKKVYQSDGVTVVFDTSGGNAWPSNDGGWKHDGAKWVWGGETLSVEGESVFYVEGDALVSSSPGTPGNPWDATVIAEGYIEISGNPHMQAKADNVLLIAGTDVNITGDLTAAGIIAAHEQVGISGNPLFSFDGYVLAEDAADDESVVVTNFISGNPQFNYDGSFPIEGATSLAVLAWWQLF